MLMRIGATLRRRALAAVVAFQQRISIMLSALRQRAFRANAPRPSRSSRPRPPFGDCLQVGQSFGRSSEPPAPV